MIGLIRNISDGKTIFWHKLREVILKRDKTLKFKNNYENLGKCRTFFKYYTVIFGSIFTFLMHDLAILLIG